MPPVSEAQRRLMHAAANTKGGVGGVSQAVGKEFSAADEPGKLPARKKPTSERLYGRKPKGFADGGKVDDDRILNEMHQEDLAVQRKLAGRRVDPGMKHPPSEMSKEFQEDYNAPNEMGGYAEGGEVDPLPSPANDRSLTPEDFSRLLEIRMSRGGQKKGWTGATRPPGPDEKSNGGKITEVAGKPIGKDDGIIAAQRGEFVVKKSAVKKLGSAVLNEINKGRLPSARLYRGNKAVQSHG